MCQELLLPHPSFGASADPRLTSRVSVLMTEERFGASKIGAATRHLLKVSQATCHSLICQNLPPSCLQALKGSATWEKLGTNRWYHTKKPLDHFKVIGMPLKPGCSSIHLHFRMLKHCNPGILESSEWNCISLCWSSRWLLSASTGHPGGH